MQPNVPFMERTTIYAPGVLMKRVAKHVTDKEGDNLSSFYTRALLNQLEREGDFSIRDEVEELENAAREEKA